MQRGEGLRAPADSGPALTEHEKDQELLYRLYRDGRVWGPYAAFWGTKVSELQREGPCEYLEWLLRRFPPLVKDNAQGEYPI